MLAELKVAERDRVVVATLIGEIDMSNAEEMRTHIVAHLRNNTLGLVMDLSRVTYVDSRGIFLLAEMHKALTKSHQRLRLSVPPASVLRRLLEIVNLPIPTDDSIEAAVERVSEQQRS